jgi:glycosyltransferase involved in cell wall biosynthesis
MRIVLDARMPAGAWGGVQQVVQGLASGFADLNHDSELLFLGYPGAREWLAPYLGRGARLIEVTAGFGRSRTRRAFESLHDRVPRLARLAAAAADRVAVGRLGIPRSDGYLESLRPDLVHFLVPQAVLTGIPSIYQPHDLQHVHLPELLVPLQVRYRDMAYRAFSEQAVVVSVMTNWGREDLCRAFGLAKEKVAVVPWAPVAGLRRPDSRSAAVGLPDLPERFLLYPAQTWPHKNHVRLLEALAVLRGRGLRVNLVSTGRLNDHFKAVQATVARLGLRDQVTFLGYVNEDVVDAVFRRATGLVFPSLFEGWGLPIVEAFAYGIPVAAADATVLPEVTGEAALLFDPYRVEGIADAVEQLWTNHELRNDLARRGRTRAESMSWKTTAATFLALYKRVAGRALDPEEARLLKPPTLVT